MSRAAAHPDARVIFSGDLNVYPRPDSLFPRGHPLYPSDQLGPLYDLCLSSLFDVPVMNDPAPRDCTPALASCRPDACRM